MTMTNSDMQSRTTRITGSGTTLVKREADYKETSRQRGTARVSTSTKMPGRNKVMLPLVTLLVVNGASREEASMEEHQWLSIAWVSRVNRCQ